MGQLEAKLWHSSDGDKIHSYCLYLVAEHVEHLATKFYLAIYYRFIFAPFCILAAKLLKTYIVNYVTSYWLNDCCSKKLYK